MTPMNGSLFRYFLYPHNFSSYSPELHKCDLCQKEKTGYEGPFYGDRDLEFICEECLIQGHLSELNTFTNDCDVNTLKQQITQRYADYTDQQVEELAQEKSFEITYCTPRIQTWQDYLWPAHCGDYCRFIKEVGQIELLQIAELEQIKDLLAIEDEIDFRPIWKSI